MPAKDLKDLLERIHTRLDESFVGIGAQVADLEAADLAELINQLTSAEAATVVSMLPVARCIELCDQPTMRRRAAILEQLEPERVAEILVRPFCRRTHGHHSKHGRASASSHPSEAQSRPARGAGRPACSIRITRPAAS